MLYRIGLDWSKSCILHHSISYLLNVLHPILESQRPIVEAERTFWASFDSVFGKFCGGVGFGVGLGGVSLCRMASSGFVIA